MPVALVATEYRGQGGDAPVEGVVVRVVRDADGDEQRRRLAADARDGDHDAGGDAGDRGAEAFDLRAEFAAAAAVDRVPLNVLPHPLF